MIYIDSEGDIMDKESAKEEVKQQEPDFLLTAKRKSTID